MIFISHASSDQRIALEVRRQLESMGHDCWIDVGRFPIGERFVAEIGQGLRSSSTALLIDSKAARSSYWVRREIMAAVRLHNQGRMRHLFSYPISGDASSYPPPLLDHVISSLKVFEDIPRAEGAQATIHEPTSVQFKVAHPYPEQAIWLGFSSELAAIDRWWHSERPGLWLTGSGGSGKTALIWTWVRALERIGYREDLNVLVSFWSFYVDPHDDRFLEFSEVMPRADRTLIILDGMEEVVTLSTNRFKSRLLEDVIRAWAGTQCKIVVSSRAGVVDTLADLFDTIALSSFSEQEIRMLFAKFAASDEDRYRLNELGKLLDGHPLALTVVRSLIEQRGEGGIQSVLDELKATDRGIQKQVH